MVNMVNNKWKMAFPFPLRFTRECRRGINKDIFLAALYQKEYEIHFFPLVPVMHPIDFGARHPKCASIERADGVFHTLDGLS